MSKYRVRFEGSGSGTNDYGIIKVIEGQVFLCDTNLADMARDFQGHITEVAFWATEEHGNMPMDPLIEPLVEALRKLDIVTLSSCEGHIGKEGQHSFPYVSFSNVPIDIMRFPVGRLDTAPGWICKEIGTNVMRLQTSKSASTLEELKCLQESIGEQVKALA